MNSDIKHEIRILPIILFYIIGLLFCFVLEKVSPSGPCNPGLGMLLFLVFIIAAFILLIVTLHKLTRQGRIYRKALFVHALGWVVLVMMMLM